MKFKVGDKVKFLNDTGGGIVSKIISSSLVNVAIEDGFDIPTLTSDLLKMESSGKVANMFDEDFNVELSEKQQETNVKDNDQEPEDERVSRLRNLSFRVKNEAGIYLAYVPHDQKWMVTGALEIYLVNHTEYDLIYSLFLEEEAGTYTGIDYDIVPARSKILIETIEREDLEKWLKGIVQFMFHKDHPEKILMPASARFTIKPVRLINEDSYKETEFIEERSVLYSLASLSSQTFVAESDGKAAQQSISQKKATEVKPQELIDKHRTGPHDAVVDLHIGELVTNIAGMSSHDMLTFQINYFSRCLENAITNNYRKVTFIHGVGNGALKNAIIKKLKEYEGLENHSASLAKFGVGAIDVVIRPLL